jgi:type II secretory pathway predicted ATPase ExeA
MKFHDTLINKLVETFEVFGGWKDQKKLKNALRELNVAVYERQDGIKILVDEAELQKARRGVAE